MALNNLARSLLSTLKSIDFSSPGAVNSLKTAIACSIGYFLTIWTSLPQPQWIVVTVLVVMSAQASIGSLFIKAKMRFWGTVGGTLGAAAIILICRKNSLEVGVAIFLFTLFFSYIASMPGDLSYVGTLGSVTLAIVVLSDHPSLTMAAERFSEISLGIIISFLVSNFILPVRSHTIFLKSVADTLIYLRSYFNDCIDGHADVLDEKILIMFAQQRRLIYEVGHEPRGHRGDKVVFQEILNSERKIYRAINLISYNLDSSPLTRSAVQSLQGFVQFRQEITQHFTDSSISGGTVFTGGDDEKRMTGIDVMRSDVQKSMINQDATDAASVYSFLSSCRILAAELDLLISNLNKTTLSKPTKTTTPL